MAPRPSRWPGATGGAAWAPALAERAPFAPLADAFAPFAESAPGVVPPLATWPPIETPAGPVRFLPEEARPTEFAPRDLYDGRIVVDGIVPSRPGSLHDFFNMIAWRAFPKAKLALHRRQYAALCEALGDAPRTSLPNRRLPIQDRLTLLDEACFLVVAPALGGLLPFGHGAMEFFAGVLLGAPSPRGDGRGFLFAGDDDAPISLAEDRGTFDEHLAARIDAGEVPMGKRVGYTRIRARLGLNPSPPPAP